MPSNAEHIRNGRVRACPECDTVSADLIANGNKADDGKAGPKYICNNCGARFDTPNYRTPNAHRNSHHGTPRDLLDADPEDWP